MKLSGVFSFGDIRENKFNLHLALVAVLVLECKGRLYLFLHRDIFFFFECFF